MKKLLSSVSLSALVLCLTLQVSHGMDNGAEKKVPSTIKFKTKSNKPNKEEYHLLKENFSKENNINFKELYNHIHYPFKNEDLLIDALYPLLPINLQGNEKKYNHLEFVGDSVLGLIIRQRIINLFPDEERNMHVRLYEALTCNKTLAEAYQQNLDIESYLPYPGEITCEYCNVVEAIIGAISEDNPGNELAPTRKFILKVLDDNLFLKKGKNLLEENKKIKLNDNKFHSQTSFVAPSHKKTIEEVLDNPKVDKSNPKSLLGMILTKIFDDRPTYDCSLGKDEDGMPQFIVNVVAAQIGCTITGIGFTKDEAEQDAARSAINFLVQEERIPQKKLGDQKQTHTIFINEYCQAQGLKFQEVELPCQNILSAPNFTYEVKMDKGCIGKGSGLTKTEAIENAAKKAYEYLIEKGLIEDKKLENNKSYQAILKEWIIKRNIFEYVPIEIEGSPSISQFTYQVKIDGSINGEGKGSTKKEAEENAAQNAYNYLVKNGQPAYEDLTNKKYKSILEEWMTQKKISGYTSIEIEALQPITEFKIQIKMDGNIIGEGMGSITKKAKENAAQNAYNYLVENKIIDNKILNKNKTYQSILQEWAVQRNIFEYDLIEIPQSITEFKFQLKIGGDVIGEGVGSPKKAARENAYRAAFQQLLKNQEEALKEKENRKILAKKVKGSPKFLDLRTEQKVPSLPIIKASNPNVLTKPSDESEVKSSQTSELIRLIPVNKKQNLSLSGQTQNNSQMNSNTRSSQNGSQMNNNNRPKQNGNQMNNNRPNPNGKQKK